MKRIEDHHELGYPGFTSRPVKLDIDDLRDVIAEMEKLGMTVHVSGSAEPVSRIDAGGWQLIEDISTVNAGHMRMVRIYGQVETNPNSGPAGTAMRFECTSKGVTVTGSPGPEQSSAVDAAVTRMRNMVKASPYNGMPARYLDRFLMSVVVVTAVALWGVWWVVDWRSWPGIVFVGLLGVLASSSKSWPWKARIRSYLIDRRWWFQEASRKEIAADRANRKKDLTVGLKVGIPTTVIGAAVGSILTALLT